MFALYGIERKDFSCTYEAWQALVHPEDRSRGSQEVEDALLGIRPFDTEFRVSLPNGDIRHIKARGQVFRDGQGKAIRIVGVNWDITERILAEKERDRLLSIIEDAPDFIATDVRALFFHQENGDRHRPIHVKNDHRKKHARRSYCPQC